MVEFANALTVLLPTLIIETVTVFVETVFVESDVGVRVVVPPELAIVNVIELANRLATEFPRETVV